MADLSLDELLSSSFKSAAEPAPSAGVADLIRARVAAGDAGTTATGTTAPGWSGLGRPAWFWPMIGVVTALAIAVGILVTVLAWPATPEPVVTTPPVPTSSPTPTPTLTPTPTPTPTPTVEPQDDDPQPPPPPPPPPSSDDPPTIQQISADPTAVGCSNGSTISVVASDDKKVTGVMLTWNGPSSGSAPMTLQGGVWSYFITMQSGTGTYTITAVAQDSKGQSSAPATIGVLRDVCIG